MAVIRIPQKNILTLQSSILNDQRLSLKAKGLFWYILSKCSDEQLSSEKISIGNNDGRDSVRTGLRELEKFNYLKRVRINNEQGHFEVEYHIFLENGR